MTLAGFIHEIESRPSSFDAEPAAWAQVLQTYGADVRGAESGPGRPRWRFWAAVFSFLARVLEWSDAAESEGWSAYLASRRARDVLDAHRPQRYQAQVRLPSFAPSRGAEFLHDFEELVGRVAAWTKDGLYGPA
jgi:hypothetical protein